MRVPVKRVEVCVPDARKVLQEGLAYFLGLEGRRAEWLPEYEQVAEWLETEGAGCSFSGIADGESRCCAAMCCLLFC